MIVKKKIILVIGSSSFFGCRLLELTPKNRYAIHSTYFSAPVGLDGISEHRLDVNDAESVDKLFFEIKPDIIIYLAKSPIWNTEFELFKKTFTSFVEKIKNHSVRLIFFSTDAVFDGKKGMYMEKENLCPTSSYGKWKKEAENIIQNNLSTATIVRTSYIYGRNRNGIDKRTQEVIDAVAEKKEIQRFSNMYRSVTFVDDLALATWRLVDLNFYGIIHIAGLRVSLFDFYQTLVQAFGYDPQYVIPQIGEETSTFGRDTSLDNTLAKRILQFSPLAIDRF